MPAQVRERARVAFVSLWDAGDHDDHSGAAYSMRRQLMRHFEVLDWFPLRPVAERALLPLKALYKARGRYYEIEREPLFLRGLARMIGRRIAECRPDAIFAPSSIPTTLLETKLPVFWSADFLFANFVEGYVARPASRCLALAAAQEARTLAGARGASFPSDWAAREAVMRYGAAPEKISVIPWGANLPHPVARESVEAGIAGRRPGQCRIVFIGKDWRRKGGALVVATVEALNRRGLPTSLEIIGCDPPIARGSRITVHPYLDKLVPGDWRVYSEALHRAHFFFMPSRAEAFGHAFCEAAAFGTPSIGSTEGGIPTLIKDGVTGFVRPRDAAPEAFADLIEAALADQDRYRAMCRAARAEFEARLNWDAFGRSLAAQIQAVL